MEIIKTYLYSDEQIAGIFGLKRRTVINYIKEGVIRGNRFGNVWYVLGSELLDHFTLSKESDVDE